jgi:hypothetical protein
VLYIDIHLEELKKIKKNLVKNSLLAGWDLSTALQDYD